MHHIESDCPVCGEDTSGTLPYGFYYRQERVVIYPCDKCFELTKDEEWQREYVKANPLFSRDMIIDSIKKFLEYGNLMVTDHSGGHFAGPGFAASALRWHLKDLEEEKADERTTG